MRCLVMALFAAFLMCARPAGAAQSYDNCTGFIASLPAVITTQGTWCMDQDLSTAISAGNAITVSTNNVTLDCNHFKLGGLAAGSATETRGIRADNVLNFTLRNCNVRGFYFGVQASGGAGHVYEHSRFEGNTVVGLLVNASSSVIRNNLVVDSGGSTFSPIEAYGIASTGTGNHVLDNIVSGVTPVAVNGVAYGIFMSSDQGGSVGRNSVDGLDVDAAAAYAIRSTTRIIVYGNTLQGVPGVANTYGIFCTSNTGTARENMISGFATGISNCQLSSNVINTN